MLHLELRKLVVPQRISGTHVTLSLTFRNRLRDTIDCEFTHSGVLRRGQTNGSTCTIYPSEITTPVPWMSHLSHELTATIEISDNSTTLYETAIRVAPLKVKHILSGERIVVELPMDKVSCSAVCVCNDMSERSSKIFLQNMPLNHIIPLFPEPITDCYLVVDAGYTIKRSIYDQNTKTTVDKVPINLVSKPKKVSVFIQGSVGDATWETVVYNGEVDTKTGELAMYELINALDVLAIHTLSTLHKSIVTKSKTSQSKEIRGDRSFTRRGKRQQEKDYKLLLNACIMEGIVTVASRDRGGNISRTCSPSVVEALATIKGLPYENINPMHLLVSYSTNSNWQSTLTRLKVFMSGCLDRWVVSKKVRNWVSTIDHKHLLAGLLQNYISPTHLTVPERIGRSQLNDILRDCDDDNVCFVLSILCRDAMTLPKVIIGEGTYFAPTSSEQVPPHKWLQTSDGSINSIHKFCLHYDIPQKSVCDFLWERLCIADPSSNIADPTAEMVMNKLSLLLTTALDTGTVEKWRSGLGKKYSLRSLFTDLIIYIITTIDIGPINMLYHRDVDGLAMEVSHIDESEESILCVDPLEEIKRLEQMVSEEDSYPKALVFSRHVQQRTSNNEGTSKSQPMPLIKQYTSPTYEIKPMYEHNPSASQSLCGQGEARMLQSLSSEASLSIADLTIEPRNDDCEATDQVQRIQQAQLPAVPRPNGGARRVVHALQAISSPLASGIQLASQATSAIFNDISCQDEDIVLSTIDHTDRTRSTTGRSGIKTAINPSIKSSSSSSINISRLNTPNNSLSTSLLSLHSNIFADIIKLMRHSRALTPNQKMLDQCTEDLIEAVVVPINQFSTSAWQREQMSAMQDLCMAAAHLRYTMLKFNSCIENADKEQVKFLITNILADNELERLLLSLGEPLLYPSHKSFSSTKETQTVNSTILSSPSKLSSEGQLVYSLLREKMLQNDKVIDSILEKAVAYSSSLSFNRYTINTTPAPSAQRSTETLLSTTTGFARSSSKDTNCLFESNYESRAGTPDICQMLESVGTEVCDQEPVIWNDRIHPYEYEGLMII